MAHVKSIFLRHYIKQKTLITQGTRVDFYIFFDTYAHELFLYKYYMSRNRISDLELSRIFFRSDPIQIFTD